MDCVTEQSSQQAFLQAPSDMVAWHAAPLEPWVHYGFSAPTVQEQDLKSSDGQDEAVTTWIQEAPQQLQMEMVIPPVREAEWEELGEQQCDANADNSQGVSKSTLRRRRRQNAQLHSAEMQQHAVAKEDGRSVADTDAAEQEETETEAAQAHELAEKLLEQLRAGGHARQSAIAGVERMAFRGKISCRAVQIALEEASAHDAAALALGMRGHVRNAMHSKFANYVIQKILETLPMSRATFIIEELVGFGKVLVRHRFGCRIICRVLEHGSLVEDATAKLLDEVLDSGAEELCNHEFGSYVIRHFLEFGLPEHRQKIAIALNADVLGYSKQRFASHVVEAALKYCSSEDQRMLAEQLMENRDQLLSLASSQFGHHVLKGMIGVAPGELRQDIVDAVRPLAGALQSLRYGKRVLQALNAASK